MVVQLPLCGRFKRWAGNFMKRRANRTITSMQDRTPFWPRRRNHRLKILKHTINPGLNEGPVVAPESHDATLLQNPHHFSPETVEVKPVQRLSNSDQID